MGLRLRRPREPSAPGSLGVLRKVIGQQPAEDLRTARLLLSCGHSVDAVGPRSLATWRMCHECRGPRDSGAPP